MGFTGLLPSWVVSKMSKAHRTEYAKGIGNANAGKLPEEIEAEQQTEAEKKLQEQICQDLNRREIEYINPSMKRRSPLPEGWPDFTFCYNGFPVLWECKKPKGKFRDSQQLLIPKLIKNGWRFTVIRSLTDARDFLRQLDAETL